MQLLASTCGLWLIGFTLAVFAQNLYIIGSCTIVFLLLLRVKLLLAIFLLGCWWGHLHQIGQPVRQTGNAEVVYSEYTGVGKANLMITSDNQRFAAKGAAFVGTTGTYRCQKVRRLFRTNECYFKSLIESTHLKPMQRLSVGARDFLRERIMYLEDDIYAWIASLVLGEYSQLPQHVLAAFRSTGTYHILVISGMHLTFLAMGMHTMLLGALQIFYALRLYPPTLWVRTWQVLPLVTISIVYGYSILTGMSSPVQRALLCFVVHRAAQIFFGGGRHTDILLIILVIQTLFYPVGIFSEGSLLSWTAYLLVMAHGSVRHRSWLHGLGATLWMQSKMCVVVAFVCGQFCWLGILINPLANPISNLLMVASIMLFVPAVSGSWCGELCMWLIRRFLDFILWSAELGTLLENSIFPRDVGSLLEHYPIQVVFGVTYCAIVLNSIKSMTIRTVCRL